MPVTLTQLDLYLKTLLGDEPDESLIEVRTRKPGTHSMRHWFIDVGARQRLHDLLPVIAGRADVYVGVAPRRTADGTRDGVTHAHVTWADVDGPEGLKRAAAFDPHPTLIVRSGSPGGAHAYWALERAADVALVEQINRGLCEALGGDPVWAATTILRVPGTLNHKHDPPRSVDIARATGEVFDPVELASLVPDVAPPPSQVLPPRVVHGRDPLMAIAPRDYVAKLLGVTVPKHGFVSCPFHSDSSPSLKVYETAERGWCCYGRCGRRGGSIFDLSARLWGLSTRGEDFLEVRRRLTAIFG